MNFGESFGSIQLADIESDGNFLHCSLLTHIDANECDQNWLNGIALAERTGFRNE